MVFNEFFNNEMNIGIRLQNFENERVERMVLF